MTDKTPTEYIINGRKMKEGLEEALKFQSNFVMDAIELKLEHEIVSRFEFYSVLRKAAIRAKVDAREYDERLAIHMDLWKKNLGKEKDVSSESMTVYPITEQ